MGWSIFASEDGENLPEVVSLLSAALLDGSESAAKVTRGLGLKGRFSLEG